MIIRIVELNIQKDGLAEARSLLEDVSSKVRNMDGCSHLHILFGIHQPGHITTYSHWTSEQHLNECRKSEVFINFWSAIKPLFSTPARAWSSETLHLLP